MAAAEVQLTISDCRACLAAGFGWSKKRARCGNGFAMRDPSACPLAPSPPPQDGDGDEDALAVSDDDASTSDVGAGGPSRAAALTPRVRTVEFTHAPPVFIDEAGPAPAWDEDGYIIAHYCQGRFGNQMDYLMGLMDMALKVSQSLADAGPVALAPAPTAICLPLPACRLTGCCICAAADQTNAGVAAVDGLLSQG
eukprot:COSAG01_NODE_5319_length_4335_cov_48.955619_6_plen_196_part_00